MKTNRSAVLVVPFILLTVAGCAQDHPANSPDNLPPATSTSTSSGVTVSGSTSASSSAPTPPMAAAAPAMGTGAASAAASDAPTALTDDQILQVTHTANLSEVEQATLALSKATDARVKKLATMMVKDHTAADAKGMTLVKNDKLNPAPSPVSTSLESDAQAATTTLKGLSGADFDKTYVDTQVKEHQAVLDTLDQKLIPSAINSDLKSYLGEVHAKVAMHLQHAQDLQKTMTH